MIFRPNSKNPLLDFAKDLIEDVQNAGATGKSKAELEKLIAQQLAFFFRDIETKRVEAISAASYAVTKSVERIEQ